MRLHFCWIPALILMLFFAGCRVEDGPAPSNVVNVTGVDVAGLVVDESDKPMSGVRVKCGGKTTHTNEIGAFYLPNVSASGTRVAVTLDKEGYYAHGKATDVTSNSLNAFRVKMVKRTIAGQLNAKVGGSVTLGTTMAKVDIPPDAIVTSSGAPYTGSVNVSMQMMRPSDDDFNELFPGDMAAIRSDSSATTLFTLGVLRVELNSPNGEQLNLAPGQKATITAPIDPSQQHIAPDSVPLWYYDMERGLWMEYGLAAKRGMTYVGTVPHFTPVNIDMPLEPLTIRGKVTCSSGPISGIWVRVGALLLQSDHKGLFEARVGVPPLSSITAKILAEENGGLFATDVTLSNAQSGEVRDVELHVSNCAGTIEGQLIDCEGGLGSGTVSISAGVYTTTHFVRNGRFSAPAPSGNDHRVRVFSINGGISHEVTIQALTRAENRDIGRLRVCAENPVENVNFELPGTPLQVALNSSGSYAAVLLDGGGSGTCTVTLIRTSDGQIMWTRSADGVPANLEPSIHFGPDEKRLLVQTRTNTNIYDLPDGKVYVRLPEIRSAMFSNDGALFHAILLNSTIATYDLTTGRRSSNFSPPNDGAIGNSGQVIGVDPDNRGIYVLTNSSDAQGTQVSAIWLITDSNQRRRILSTSGLFKARDFRRNGQEVILVESGTTDIMPPPRSRIAVVSLGEERVYMQATGYIAGTKSMAGSAALSFDGETFIRQSADNVFGLFNYRDQTRTRIFGFSEEIGHVVWASSDEQSKSIAVIREDANRRRNLRIFRR